MSSLVDRYLDEKPKYESLIQARVPSALRRQVRTILKRDHIEWNELITACLKAFLEEHKAKDFRGKTLKDNS